MAVKKILGLMGTMLAMVMGAPFEFEIHNKTANLRGAGAKLVMRRRAMMGNRIIPHVEQGDF